MSGKSGRRPPFLQKSGAIPVAKTAPIPPKPKTAELPPPPPLSQNTELAQRTQGTPEDHVSKKARKDESVLPAPKHPSTATPIHHLFAKHGYNHAIEEECTSCVGAELIDNAESLSKCLSEAFIRQTSHLKELKTLASVKTKLEKEVTVLKFQKEEDMRSLMKTHRLALETETATLRSELKKITDERNTFSKSLKEAEELEETLRREHGGRDWQTEEGARGCQA